MLLPLSSSPARPGSLLFPGLTTRLPKWACASSAFHTQWGQQGLKEPNSTAVSHALPGVWGLVPHGARILSYCTSPPLSFRWATQTHSLSSGTAKAWLGILTLRPVQAMDTARAFPHVSVRKHVLLHSDLSHSPTGWQHCTVILTWFLALMLTLFSNSSFILST